MEIKIYTDGACTGNPGPGGWAAIILFEKGKKELFGGERLTTNNRMELTAAIKGLEYCDSQERKQLSLKEIKIYTDSVYLKEGITNWIVSLQVAMIIRALQRILETLFFSFLNSASFSKKSSWRQKLFRCRYLKYGNPFGSGRT